MTGKSTLLLKTYLEDQRKYHLSDLCINLWTFLHRDKRFPHSTPNSISCPSGRLRALELPFDPNQWIPTISAYHRAHPQIHRIMLDEVQCLPAVQLVTLVMVIRDFYPDVPVLFTCIDFDSWHHKFPQISALIQMVNESHHLHHRCMLCSRVATRRLHVVNHKPCYNEQKYDDILRHHKYTQDGKPNLYSVCSRHYHHLPEGFEKIMKKKLQGPTSPQQKIQQIRKNLGLGSNVKIRVGRNRMQLKAGGSTPGTSAPHRPAQPKPNQK